MRHITAFDALDREINLVELSPAGAAVSTFVDTYDLVGMKTRQSRNGNVATYTYDAANRLTGQTKATATATFVYDAVGNPLMKWHQGLQPVTMAYDAAQRVTTEQNGPTLVVRTFDNAGNMTVENRGGVLTNFSYSGDNRMVSQVNPDGTRLTNTYQGDGMRRSLQTATRLTTFVWDGQDYLQERF